MNRLKKLRIEKGVTQKVLAEVIDKTIAAYSTYETGIREMDYSALIALADFYDCSIDYILGRTNDLKTETNITGEEQQILDDYNSLSPTDKGYIRGLLCGLAKNKKDSITLSSFKK